MIFRSLTHFPVLICAGDSLFNCSLRVDITILIIIIIITTAFTDGSCHDDIEICGFLCRLGILFYLEFDFILLYKDML